MDACNKGLHCQVRDKSGACWEKSKEDGTRAECLGMGVKSHWSGNPHPILFVYLSHNSSEALFFVRQGHDVVSHLQQLVWHFLTYFFFGE